MVEILDKILLSKNVVENFYYAYKDVDFEDLKYDLEWM